MSRGRRGGLKELPPAVRAVPPAPAVPGRRRLLTSDDRASIATGLRAGWSLERIGTDIGRDRSVVKREVDRNSSPDGAYRGPVAQQAARQRRRRPKPFKLTTDPQLCAQIEDWMEQGWSPGLIARVLKRDRPDNTATSSGAAAGARMSSVSETVSHETIYKALYVQTRGSLRQDLHRQLSTHRSSRRPRGTKRGNSPYREAFTISQRPPEVADRAVPGHWEGDLVMGTNGGVAVGTLVERTTRFTILLHLPGRHDADTVATLMIQQISRLPEHLRKSLTWDRGTELARYEKIQLVLDMPVYFCDPHSPWQRGTNENTNRLLRHWLTKGSDLSRFTAHDLDTIAATLNARPRPTLDLKTPAQALDALLTNPTAA